MLSRTNLSEIKPQANKVESTEIGQFLSELQLNTPTYSAFLRHDSTNL